MRDQDLPVEEPAEPANAPPPAPPPRRLRLVARVTDESIGEPQALDGSGISGLMPPAAHSRQQAKRAGANQAPIAAPRNMRAALDVMTKAFRRYGLPGLGLLIVLIVVMAVAPLLMPSETLRRQVAIEIAALTGQQVAISGATSLRTLPWPVLSVERVQIGEGERSPIVETSAIEARLSLLPLLLGRIEVAGLTLVKPKINLVVEANGSANWRSGSSMLALLVPDPEASDHGPQLGDFAIRGGTISYRDNQAGRRSELSDVEVSISWPLLASRLQTSGHFRLRGEEIRFVGALDRPSALFQRDISPFELSFDTDAIKAELSGNALAARDIQLEGQLTFTSPSIKKLTAWLVPEAQNAPDIGPVEGVSKLKIVERSMNLEEARLTVARAKGEGALVLTFDKTRSSIQGTMDFDSIDASPFVQIQIPTGTEDPSLSAEPIPSDRLGPVDVDLRLSTARLLVGNAEIRQAAVSFMARDGRVEASIGDGQVFGGHIAGRFVTEARNEGGVRARGTLSLTGIQMDDPLREYFGIIRLAGTGSISLNLNAEGVSPRQLATSVKGEASIRIGPASLTGVDMSALVRRVDRNALEALLDMRGGRSTVETASATFRIENGLASTDDATIRGPGYRVALRGGANFANRSLAFTGTLASQTTGETSRSGPELPFIIRGPWRDPVVVPNPDGLTRRTPPASIEPNPAPQQ